MTVFRNLFGYMLTQIGLVKNLTLTNLFFFYQKNNLKDLRAGHNLKTSVKS